MPAVGFALHLDAVARAREAAGVEEETVPRVVVAIEGERGEAIAARLREAGVPAIIHPVDGDPEGYAAAWGFSRVLSERDGGIDAAIAEIIARK